MIFVIVVILLLFVGCGSSVVVKIDVGSVI